MSHCPRLLRRQTEERSGLSATERLPLPTTIRTDGGGQSPITLNIPPPLHLHTTPHQSPTPHFLFLQDQGNLQQVSILVPSVPNANQSPPVPAASCVILCWL